MKTSLEIFAQNLRDTLEAQRKSQSDLYCMLILFELSFENNNVAFT